MYMYVYTYKCIYYPQIDGQVNPYNDLHVTKQNM